MNIDWLFGANVALNELTDELTRPRSIPSEAKPKVTLEEMIKRRKCHVKVDGKIYRIEVTPVA